MTRFPHYLTGIAAMALLSSPGLAQEADTVGGGNVGCYPKAAKAD